MIDFDKIIHPEDVWINVKFSQTMTNKTASEMLQQSQGKGSLHYCVPQ